MTACLVAWISAPCFRTVSSVF